MLSLYGARTMNKALPTLIATSVVRGSYQGESHGGVYTVDFASGEVAQRVDWNTSGIDFAGRGADRGLRGIAFDGELMYIAASDELFCFNRQFEIVASWHNRYLRHCHEICRYQRTLYLTSTGFDSILGFDLDKQVFSRGLLLQRQLEQWVGATFDPTATAGPSPRNEQHLNMVHADRDGIFLSGLRTRALLRYRGGNDVTAVCNLPGGCHNARPFRGGVLFNDTRSDRLQFVAGTGSQRVYRPPRYSEKEIEFSGVDKSRIARQGFARGLCVVDDQRIAGGSSPSTVSLYDLASGDTLASINLTRDIRNAVHGLERWPY